MARSYHKAPDRVTPRLLRKPQLTLVEIATATDRADRQKSASVRLVNIRRVKPPVGLSGYRVTRGDTVTAENVHQHSVRVFYADDPNDPNLKLNTPVIVDCTCPRFAFFYEVANAKVGASFIYRSNGATPNITNPGMHPGLCKHAYRLISYLLRLGGKRKTPGEAQAVEEKIQRIKRERP